jgi:hypothetical protein
MVAYSLAVWFLMPIDRSCSRRGLTSSAIAIIKRVINQVVTLEAFDMLLFDMPTPVLLSPSD